MDAYLKLSKNNILYNLIKLKQLVNGISVRSKYRVPTTSVCK